MPEVLRRFLQSLNETDSKDVYDFLDDDADALGEMLELIEEKAL